MHPQREKHEHHYGLVILLALCALLLIGVIVFFVRGTLETIKSGASLSEATSSLPTVDDLNPLTSIFDPVVEIEDPEPATDLALLEFEGNNLQPSFSYLPGWHIASREDDQSELVLVETLVSPSPIGVADASIPVIMTTYKKELLELEDGVRFGDNILDGLNPVSYSNVLSQSEAINIGVLTKISGTVTQLDEIAKPFEQFVYETDLTAIWISYRYQDELSVEGWELLRSSLDFSLIP
jgi:hypothetical protein